MFAPMPDPLDEQLGALLGLEQWALRDPYPIYVRLRSASPVHIHGSTVFLTRFDDVQVAFRDNARVVSRREGARIDSIYAALEPDDATRFAEIRAFEERQMVRLDEPDHSPNREIGHSAFTP